MGENPTLHSRITWQIIPEGFSRSNSHAFPQALLSARDPERQYPTTRSGGELVSKSQGSVLRCHSVATTGTQCIRRSVLLGATSSVVSAAILSECMP